jgi:hypothetical protein
VFIGHGGDRTLLEAGYFRSGRVRRARRVTCLFTFAVLTHLPVNPKEKQAGSNATRVGADLYTPNHLLLSA